MICAWIVAFFPILSNTIVGLNSADHNLIDLFQLYRANRWQTLRYLRLPAALPYFLAGLKISGGLALIGVGLLIMPAARRVEVLAVAVSALALGMGLTQPSLNSLISRGAAREEQGEVLGVSQSVGSLSRVLGPAAAGFYFATFGRNAAFLWGAALIAGALLLTLKLIRSAEAAKLAGVNPVRPSR